MEWKDSYNSRLRNCFNFRGSNLSYILKKGQTVHIFPSAPWDIIKGTLDLSTDTLTLEMRDTTCKFENLKIADIIKILKLYRG